MMNSRWQANKIGLINFWYYDEQEFPFVKGRMLLRGSNGSGKSVTMQSVVPLLLDGNMSPERLDPFGSRDRKMSSYLLEEDDGREERTGYLYLEFKRKDSDTYLTIGMGIRARKGKNLDKWYFSLTDGRRVGKDFFLYKDTGEKVTLSKKELENRIGAGGRVIDRQADYMEYVNHQIFGFETAEEYKEMIDLLIQLRTPKLSKDFKPSVINDILSDSLQPLSDDDLRPMSEAIENMDTMNMNLKNRKEAKQAAEKIQAVFLKYNQKLLYEKADRYEQAKSRLEDAETQQKEQEKKLDGCRQNIEKLKTEHQELDAKRESMEKERESLNKSDAVALKRRESELAAELEVQQKNLKGKKHFLELKQDQYKDAQNQIKAEEDRKYEKEKELEKLIEEMQDEADTMAFEEHAFMKDELEKHPEEPYKFELHQQQYNHTKEKIHEGTEILAETDHLERQKDDLIKEREKRVRELDTLQRKVSELEAVFVQTQNEWKENLYQWNGANQELVLEKELLRALSIFAEFYEENSDFAEVRQKIADVWIEKNAEVESGISANRAEKETTERELEEVKAELSEWENQKEPQPERSEAVIRNRRRLDALGIPYQEFYKVIEFGNNLDEKECNRLEEALLKMGILDALVIDEQYKEQVLHLEQGCEDHYLFSCKNGQKDIQSEHSLLDVLELNEEVNDIFSNQRLTGILGSIAYDNESMIAVAEDGTYRMGVLAGTVTGEYEAGYLGTKAREKHRQAKIEACRQRIAELEEILQQLEEMHRKLFERKDILRQEYENLPKDTDMREVGQLTLRLEDGRKRIEEYEKKTAYFSECYEQEKRLHYVEIPEEIPDDAGHVRSYLESDVKALDKDSVIRDLNKVYFENRGFLTDYHLMQNELFAEAEQTEFSAKRLDISARYQGVKISFLSLLTHLEEDIEELENLIKDGDRELFEDILANTVSRKIRGKINASNTWVQKMNSLMNDMNTSSGLKLSLRWRSKTAEQEDQLDTKELVDLLKKDYRLMSKEEASRLSAHFRSKVAEARRNARDSAGMISFYQIMKDTLDYRKWFEFQLFSQKNGERQKELTNSVFGTFSGGEKAMSMYVPLFSAVVAKYQGGRKDAPKLISLDEAFAGVDNRNIRDMFRLMTEFGFDFIINSQVLWGDCDTLDALAIYQLIRPGNAKFVTVMPYLWNGHKKELLEHEEEVEQRGIELGMASENH